MSIAKHIGIFVASLVMMLAFASSALATITIESVRYDANTLTPSSTNFIFAADRGQNVPVKVQVKSDVDVDNVQVETVLRGYDHDDMVEDITDTFDMKAGQWFEWRNLRLQNEGERHLCQEAHPSDEPESRSGPV